MSKISEKRRRFEIRQKQKRKKKIKKPREKYLAAKSREAKEKILEKIEKIAPHYPMEEILKLEKPRYS